MKSTVKRSINLLLISLVISFLLSMFSNLKIDTFFHFFVYFLSLLVLPDWLRNNKINLRIKIFLTILVGIISITTLICISGIGRSLYTYTIMLCVVIICIIIDNYRKRAKD